MHTHSPRKCVMLLSSWSKADTTPALRFHAAMHPLSLAIAHACSSCDLRLAGSSRELPLPFIEHLQPTVQGPAFSPACGHAGVPCALLHRAAAAGGGDQGRPGSQVRTAQRAYRTVLRHAMSTCSVQRGVCCAALGCDKFFIQCTEMFADTATPCYTCSDLIVP